jgi:hypothetical protein
MQATGAARLFLLALCAAVAVPSSSEQQQGAFVGLSADHDLVLMPEANKKVLMDGLDIRALITGLQSQLAVQVSA